MNLGAEARARRRTMTKRVAGLRGGDGLSIDPSMHGQAGNRKSEPAHLQRVEDGPIGLQSIDVIARKPHAQETPGDFISVWREFISVLP